MILNIVSTHIFDFPCLLMKLSIASESGARGFGAPEAVGLRVDTNCSRPFKSLLKTHTQVS